MVDEIKLTVVMAMYNGAHLTDDVIRQLNEQTHASFDLVVVDDSSQIPYDLPKFTKGKSWLFRHSENIGCSNAWNTGITKAVDEGADYVCVIGNDIQISENMIEVMLKWHRKGYDVSPVVSDMLGHYYLCDFEGPYRRGLHGHCFSVSAEKYKTRYSQDGYYFDTNFRGGNHEDIDFWMWYCTQGYDSHVIVKECSMWGNLSYTSTKVSQPNGPYLQEKWKDYDIDLVINKFCGLNGG